MLFHDSQIVLQWIKTQKQLQAFVHHRITEIRSLLPNATWRYCPTLENPADLLTRGITTQSLLSSTLDQNGSPHLSNGQHSSNHPCQHSLLHQRWPLSLFQLNTPHQILDYMLLFQLIATTPLASYLL